MAEPTAVVGAFNDAINRRDLDALAALMTDDHVFTDAAGGHVDGKPSCLDAWRGFFVGYPDYRNVFTELTHDGGGVGHDDRVGEVGDEGGEDAVVEWWGEGHGALLVLTPCRRLMRRR